MREKRITLALRTLRSLAAEFFPVFASVRVFSRANPYLLERVLKMSFFYFNVIVFTSKNAILWTLG